MCTTAGHAVSFKTVLGAASRWAACSGNDLGEFSGEMRVVHKALERVIRPRIGHTLPGNDLLRRFSLRKEQSYFKHFVCSFLHPRGDRGAPVPRSVVVLTSANHTQPLCGRQ